MTGELSTETYDDAAIAVFIEQYPLTDKEGESPTINGEANTAWTETYDLNRAAADIWDEKAALLVPKFDISADGANMSRSQMYEHAQKRAKYYRSKRSMSAIDHVSNIDPDWTEATFNNNWSADDLD